MIESTTSLLQKQANFLLKSKSKDFIKCPACKKGKYGGIFYKSCDNNFCRLYDSFAMGKCYICKDLRIKCTC